jgi:acyl-CoA dehydrogenase
MNEQQLLLKDTVDRLFAELAASRVENDSAAEAFAGRWAQFAEMGLQGLLVPEAEDGFEGGGTESWLVCHAAGRKAIDLPVVEAIIAAGLLAGAGLAIPAGVLSIASRVEGELTGDKFEGSLKGVPWGRHADHVVGIFNNRLICVATAGAEIVHHANMADEPRDEVRVGPTSVVSARCDGPGMLHHGALARAAQIAGASRSAMDLAIAHVTDRTQFGKPLAKFQAVQHSLATLAEQVAAAEAASRAALEAGGGSLETASAKIIANLASEAAVTIAHQMHGAIGFTWEYALHHFTRRLIAWRAEFGNARHWNGVLGTLAAEQGADDYWAFVVAGSSAATA